jgi:hypothetical protein
MLKLITTTAIIVTDSCGPGLNLTTALCGAAAPIWTYLLMNRTQHAETLQLHLDMKAIVTETTRTTGSCSGTEDTARLETGRLVGDLGGQAGYRPLGASSGARSHPSLSNKRYEGIMMRTYLSRHRDIHKNIPLLHRHLIS